MNIGADSQTGIYLALIAPRNPYRYASKAPVGLYNSQRQVG